MQTRDIENCLLECLDVREACVLQTPAPAGKLRYHAFVVLSRDEPVVREYLHAHCNVHLKKMRPMMQLHLLDHLPKTAAGSVARGTLAALHA